MQGREGTNYRFSTEIRSSRWLIPFPASALLAALVLTPAPLALSASRTRPLSMLLLVLTAVLAKVLAPLVQSSRNNHSVPNPLCSVCCAGDFLMQKFIDDLIQALYPAAELFLLLWYRAFALFYTLYGTLTHFTERLQGTANYTAAWSIPAKFRRTIGYGRQETE